MYRVIIVEDEPVMRQGLIRLLHLDQYGYHLCGEAENGAEALGLIDAFKPHVVITDIKMPLMDGLELIQHVKESGRPEPRFILLSGYHEFEYARTALRFGVADYLLKPVNEDELISLLKKIAEELEIEDRKRFKEATRKSLIGQWDAEDDDPMWESLVSARPGPYRYVGISLDEAFRQRYRGRIHSLFGGIDEAGGLIAVLDEDGLDVGLLLAGKELEEIGDQWEPFVNKISDMLSVFGDAETQPDPYLYIGEQVGQFQLLRNSYRAAKLAGKLAMQSDKNFIVSDHMNERFRRFRSLPEQSFKLLLEAIESLNPEQIERSVSQIFEGISDRQLDQQSIRAHLYAFGLEVSGLIATLSGHTESSGWEEDFYQLCHQPPRKLADLKQRLLLSCLNCAEHLHRVRNLSATSVIVELERYIQKHYRQPITLKEIAKMNYLHPIYLGQLFKRTTGLHFKDYLHKVRIEEAKLQLRRSNRKVYEIANFVGYPDQDYFIDKFKKLSGMTPTQYRENH